MISKEVTEMGGLQMDGFFLVVELAGVESVPTSSFKVL